VLDILCGLVSVSISTGLWSDESSFSTSKRVIVNAGFVMKMSSTSGL
jgi:hypothetical protein